ncbi:MAG TPA: hemolysin family protein [Phycisphaerae bacterium]|nr:hemolysin family protein [Phycisphaerae bacterium]HNU44118.1 hemolysin family protein [Phycisphaerae bacterium]
MMIWLFLALLLVCSGMISASETALFALPRSTLEQLRRSERPLWRQAHLLMQRPRRVLLTVLLANTAVNVAIFAGALLALRQASQSPAALVALGSVGVLLAVLLFGEMVPKALALNECRRLAPLAAGVITLLQTALAPVLWLLNTVVVEPLTRLLAPQAPASDAVTSEELHLLVEQSAAEGVLDPHEQDMLQGVLELGETKVREVMTPRVDVQWVDTEAAPAAVHSRLARGRHQVVPICRGDLDHVHGLVRARDVYLNPNQPLRKLMEPAAFLPEQATLLHALEFLRRAGRSAVIVVDEYGGTAGLLLLKDLLQRIVGGFVEHDEPGGRPVLERLDENTYLLPGNLSVRVWAERFGIAEMERHFDTLGGLVLARLGRLPRVGDVVSLWNLKLTVTAVRGRRIEQVLLHRSAPVGEQPGERP